VLIGGQASEGFKPFREVVGHQEGVEVRFELCVRAVMVALNGGLLERSVHSATQCRSNNEARELEAAYWKRVECLSRLVQHEQHIALAADPIRGSSLCKPQVLAIRLEHVPPELTR
jgi:hypothetical protein